MKKIYILATALFLGANTQAQVFDFESIVLTAESYDNGSGGITNFNNGSITLFNDYNTGGGYWSGFSISNVTDNTTPGYPNQYSSFTGGGKASTNYGVFTYAGDISGNSDIISIESIAITNATYAAISMRDGDGPGGFAKQFGSVNGADGNPDGTNGEDFFKVWIIGEDYTGAVKDSVEFYLADYRFSDNTQDYIVEDWNTIDFTPFAFAVNKVNFRFESSDMSFGFINTPAYLIVDDIVYNSDLNVSENSLLTVSISPNPVRDVLNISGESGKLTIVDINGRIVNASLHNEFSSISFSNMNSGIYFVSIENEKGSFTQKIIK